MIRTPLEQALLDVETLKRCGIKPTDSHFHIGENGTRCEFCGKPSWAAIHDPLRSDAETHHATVLP